LATLESLRDQIKEEILRDPKFLTLLALERSIFDVRSALAGAAAPPPRIAPPAELASLVDDHLARHAGAAVGASGLGVIGPQIDGSIDSAALRSPHGPDGHAQDEAPAGRTAVSPGDQAGATALTEQQMPAAALAPDAETTAARAGLAQSEASEIAKEEPDAATDVTAAASQFPDAAASAAAEAAFAGAIVGTIGPAIRPLDEAAAAAPSIADLPRAEEAAVAASLAPEEATAAAPAGVTRSDVSDIVAQELDAAAAAATAAPNELLDATASAAPEAAMSEAAMSDAIVATMGDEIAIPLVDEAAPAAAPTAALPDAEDLDTAAPPAPEEARAEAPVVAGEPASARDFSNATASAAPAAAFAEAIVETMGDEAAIGLVHEADADARPTADVARAEDSETAAPSAPEQAMAEALCSVADGEPAIIVVEELAAGAEDSAMASSPRPEDAIGAALASIADGEPAIIVVEEPVAGAQAPAAFQVAEASTITASPDEAMVQALASIAEGEPGIIVVEEPAATAEPTTVPPATMPSERTSYRRESVDLAGISSPGSGARATAGATDCACTRSCAEALARAQPGAVSRSANARRMFDAMDAIEVGNVVEFDPSVDPVGELKVGRSNNSPCTMA
jgi:ribonuclease E